MSGVRYNDFENKPGIFNGALIHHRDELAKLFAAIRRQPPFIGEFRRGNAAMTVGVGEVCSIQFCERDEPPYMMAVYRNSPVDEEEYVEYLCGGTPTPVALRYTLPCEIAEAVLSEFVAAGRMADLVSWEEI